MQIAVIGVGGIGSAFAFQLALANHDVTAVARPASLRWRQLKHDQSIVKTTGERVAVRVTDKLDEEIAYDLVLATLLVHQVEAVLPALDQEDKLNAKIGAAGQKSRMNSKEWVNIFTKAGLPTVLEPDMLLWLRCQAPLGAALKA